MMSMDVHRNDGRCAETGATRHLFSASIADTCSYHHMECITFFLTQMGQDAKAKLCQDRAKLMIELAKSAARMTPETAAA
jgi:hypothetical protein